MEFQITLTRLFFNRHRQRVILGCWLGFLVLIFGGCTTVPILPEDFHTNSHPVSPEDTLWKLAEKYHQDVHELAEWAGIPWPYKLEVGWEIPISRPYNYGSKKNPSKLKFHITGLGDTWEKIAREYGTSIDSLKEWNSGLAPPCCTIDPGLKMLVSPPRDYYFYKSKSILGSPLQIPFSYNGSFPYDSSYATVKRGKGWSDIAKQCGCPSYWRVGKQLQKKRGKLKPGRSIPCNSIPCN